MHACASVIYHYILSQCQTHNLLRIPQGVGSGFWPFRGPTTIVLVYHWRSSCSQSHTKVNIPFIAIPQMIEETPLTAWVRGYIMLDPTHNKPARLPSPFTGGGTG